MINQYSRPTADVAEQQWATLSFVPEDLTWFDWIIRQLEGYPIPAELAGAPTRFGFELPAKLTLFPDRWNPLNFESYESALETSRFLVVVISPNSAESSWIEDQMDAFRRCGGEERIVALVVDGRPDGSGGSGSSDWLPNWLTRRLAENGFTPAGSSEPVVIDVRGAGEKLEKARESLLATLLSTTCQELERMGGLAPPLDLLLPSAQAVAPAPKTEALPATCVPNPPRYSRKAIPIAASVALLLFGSGWFFGRMTAPISVPLPVDVSHKRRPNALAPDAAPTPAAVAPNTLQIANVATTGEPASVPNATPIANAAEIVALPSPVSQRSVVAPTPESEPPSESASTVAVRAKPANDPSSAQGAPTDANAQERIALPTPPPEPPMAAAAPNPESAAPSKLVTSTTPSPEPSVNRTATPIANAAEKVALPVSIPSRPVPVPAPVPVSVPAIGPTSDPVAPASPNPVPSSLAPSSGLPVIGREQNAPLEQTEREQIEREQRRRDDEALRAQWLSQVAAADMALRKGKMMQATDFYNAAVATAERYAARRSDDVSSLTEMAKLCRKLGAMQLQTASVGEARATFERGRKFLALLKSSTQLTPAHTQILQELESALQTLPRD